MKISYTWLKNHIELNESPEQVSSLLTNCGLEVEKLEVIESIKGGLNGFVIGEVITCENHPGADKLKKLTVNVGVDGLLPIVCGASNVSTGQKVIVATVGTTIYSQDSDTSFVIKKAKIRGEISEGMVCSEDEIGIGKSHDGILVIDTEMTNGTPASKFFKIENDYIFEIGLTPNRADAASHLGVARDLKALLKRDLISPHFCEFKIPSNTPNIQVEVLNTADCPRYTGISMGSVIVKESPLWLQKYLKSIGLAPINNVVDITNFILHDLGQPLHAFDLSSIKDQKLVVKNLPDNYEFVTLDGVTRKLNQKDLMICDAEKALAIAGVFGGKNSGVNLLTTDIFIESAYFNPNSIRKTSMHHGLKTEASFRYERGTDPEITLKALQKAVQMITEICGGVITSNLVDIYPEPIKPIKLEIRISRINKLIGKAIPQNRVVEILNFLDIKIENSNNDLLEVIIPPYRVDVMREADIVEEILRIYGLNNIELEAKLSTAFIAETPQKSKDKIQEIISFLLVSQGFFEIITNSLTKSSYNSILNKAESAITVINPLSESLDTMRQNLLFTGLEVLNYNVNRQKKDLKLYEFGKIYHKYNSKYIQNDRLSILLSGNVLGESYSTAQKEVDLQFLKLIVESILNRMGIYKTKISVLSNNLYEECITIEKSGKTIGILGKLNASILKTFDLKLPAYHADLDFETIYALNNSNLLFNEISKFPEVRRDLSLVLQNAITFQEISELALKTEKKILKNLNVFDVYQGDKIENGKKAYSISFVLQDSEQTLTDKVIDQTMKKLIEAFEKELGAIIRNKS